MRDGRIIDGALEAKGISEEELHAGLRKLGHAELRTVKIKLEAAGEAAVRKAARAAKTLKR